ncbi:MAG: FAD-linked oxidase [Deltaproteobacteria bacterium RIFOXYA12_FULL_58_15]|nr:MAG: FAD-linked oxidase [Deltaproteobacteria bacterium RIFOXYA12_FULL_58_15]
MFADTNKQLSWGRYPERPARRTRLLSFIDAKPCLELAEGERVLPYGLGRSYGDSCLNGGGTLLLTTGMDRISFDSERGLIRCEAGVSLASILQLIVPRGWFLSVTPGTKFVTVGGAIANDVHGKNHHVAGTFGDHVVRLELLRSDGQILQCSPTENPDFFAATIGGLGLTGLILSADFTLTSIESPFIRAESLCFDSLDEFFALSKDSEPTYQHAVAWFDATARGRRSGRGVFFRGNNAPAIDQGRVPRVTTRQWSIPLPMPNWALNSWSMKAFNVAYYMKNRGGSGETTSHYDGFFYPLDAIGEWNRIYGPRGFLQYQCVIPKAAGEAPVAEMIREISNGPCSAFLTVLKMFGDKKPRGLLSFPRHGCTLAIDFPFQGDKTLRFLERLDRIVGGAGGALYPAKDARMSPDMFRLSFHKLDGFCQYVDPAFSSSFWRRVDGARGGVR